MKLIYLSIALALISFTQTSFGADVLTLNPGTQTCEGITLAESATLNLPSSQVNLISVGYGLRTKRVAIVNVKVYCATFLVSEPGAYLRTSKTTNDTLSSTDSMSAVAFRLDFVRNVDAATVSQSFADALNANNVDLTKPSVAAFLAAVKNGGDVQSGKALTIAGDEKTGLVLYQSTTGSIQSIQGDAALVHAIVSIWLGNPADSGLATLKSELIGG